VVRHALYGGLVALMPLLAHAQPAPPPATNDVVKAVAQASAPDTDIDVAENVQEQMEAYLKSSGLQARAQRHELEILQGVSSVAVPATNPDWVQHRAVAYDDALLQAEGDYVKQQGLRITDETIRRFYQAAGQEPPPYDAGRAPGQEAELIRKLLAVANGKLDGELRNLGIDPQQFNEAPPPQRYVQFQNALKRRTVRDAFGELVGLMPVQTFEGHDGKGNYWIGVIAVVSPRLKELAQQVLSAHGNLPPDPSRAQDLTIFYADKPALVRDFGVRQAFDAAGYPVLISFAQSASAYRGSDPAIADQYNQAAREQAEAKADGQLAQFLNGSMSFHAEDESGRAIDKEAERLSDNYEQDDAARKSVIAATLTILRNRAQVQVTGIQTLTRWQLKHPDTGQKIIGVVRMWSAAGEQATRALRDQHGAAPAPAPAAGQATQAPAVAKGRDLMNASDF
jgi:hypothetical protein